MLDTYEDLVVDPQERDEALGTFADRFAPPMGPAPAIGGNHAKDSRDRAHLLLVQRAVLVDGAFADLDPQVQELIRVLVRDMSDGMRWSSATFVEQGGVLLDEAQLARYCRGVLSNPVLFSSRLVRWHQTGDAELPPEVEEQALVVGEMIQLANVTRDIEKDLHRGVAYHPALRDDLGVENIGTDAALAERVRVVREELLKMALRRAPAYRPLIEYLSPSRISLVRASGVLMLAFTDQYYRSCARRAGLEPWGPRQSSLRVILSSLPSVWSRRSAHKALSKIERDFVQASSE
jgi:phytoene/squalene synthetase